MSGPRFGSFWTYFGSLDLNLEHLGYIFGSLGLDLGQLGPISWSLSLDLDNLEPIAGCSSGPFGA